MRFVGGISPARHQRKLIKKLQEVGDHPKAGKKLLIVMPPGAGKSTIIILFLAWIIGRYPDEHYGLFSYADQVGWERSRAIRDVIEHSKPYKLTFPEIQPNRTSWGVESFQVKRNKVGDPHPTLRAGGTSSAVVAYRINGLVIDDAHDPKNSNTTTLRDKVFKNYEDAITTRLTTGAFQVIIGTRWADKDLIGRLLERKRSQWDLLHIPALYKSNGLVTSYWPEHYPYEELDTKRYESPALFQLQYMGDTTGGETGIIRRLQTYEEDPILLADRLELVCASGWDTALKDRESNDFTVGYVGGLSRDGRVYILDRYKGRPSLPDLMEDLNDLHSVYKMYMCWFEDTANGTPATQMLRAQMPHIPTETIRPTQGGKNPRAHALAPFLHGGHVLFPAHADWFPDAKYNLTYFPYTDHDDDVDALYILVANLTSIRHPLSTIERPRAAIRMR